MRKVIQQAQNVGKALEIRLEEEANNKYYVILAGMTVQLPGRCVAGVCDWTTNDDYFVMENETYHTFPFTTYHEGKSLFDALSRQYMQGA